MSGTTEVWLRVAGVLEFNIGVYYRFDAAHEATQFFQASFYTRACIFVVLIGFVSIGLAHWALKLFGRVD